MTNGGTPSDAVDVPVGAAVVERDGKVLLALRPSGKRHGGSWEFPGGKVRDGEGLGEALRRELAEELDLEVTEVGPTLFEGRDPGTSFVIRFAEVHVVGEPEAREHDEVRWVPWPGVSHLALAPVDAAFAAWRRTLLLGGD